MHTDGLAARREVELDDVRRDGEVMVRGPNVCVGLFDDPERERSIFTDDGWLRTGDVGVLDDDGYLTIVGRKKEIIIRGGLNIAPREIEDLLCEMPAVRAAAVIGLPDERLGEITCACLVVDDGRDARPRRDRRLPARSRDLATYKLPQQVRIVSELPTTPSGKVRKNELRELILGGRAVMEAVTCRGRRADPRDRARSSPSPAPTSATRSTTPPCVACVRSRRKPTPIRWSGR